MASRADGAAKVDGAGEEARADDRAETGVAGGDAVAGQDWLDDPQESYWLKVELCEALWESHAERWPEPAGKGGDHHRESDPPGSWRGDGGRYLTPDQNAEADKLIETLRAPEKSVTATLLQIQQDNTHSGHLEGIDHRLKGVERLKEKIADALESEVGSSLSEVASEINDAVRYTFSFDTEDCAGGYWEVREKLELAGYTMTYSKNHWIEDPQYKGINSRWETPDGEGCFELQFHTPESFHAKHHLTHRSYERLRSNETSWEELPELENYQRAVAAALPQPKRIDSVPFLEMRDLDE